MNVNKKPCTSCPYRTDHPAGVWAADEYRKLPQYETGDALSVFMCHQMNAHGRETVCRGWLQVERDSVAARIGYLTGKLSDEDAFTDCGVALFASGAAACEHGLRGLRRPDDDAKKMMQRLARKGAGRVAMRRTNRKPGAWD